MAEWHNLRISKMPADLQAAYNAKVLASKLASKKRQEFVELLHQAYGSKLPSNKRFAVSEKPQWDQIGLKIVDKEEQQPKVERKAQLSLDGWIDEQLSDGHTV